jgi:hypothetical protein
MLSEGGLKQHYMTNHNLLYHHKIDPRIFDEMIPWERDLEISLLIKDIEEENNQREMQASQNRARRKIKKK